MLRKSGVSAVCVHEQGSLSNRSKPCLPVYPDEFTLSPKQNHSARSSLFRCVRMYKEDRTPNHSLRLVVALFGRFK